MPDPRAASEATSSGVPEDPRAGSLGDPGTRTRTETHPGNPSAIAGGARSSWRERCPPGYRRDAGATAVAPARPAGWSAGTALAPRYVPSRDDAKRARTDADAPADANADANADAHRAHPDADPSTSAGYGVAVAASEEWARALLDAAETRAARRKRRGSSRRDDPGPGEPPSEGEGPQTSTRDASHAASPSSSRAAVRAAAHAVLADPVALAALARRHLARPVARGDDAADEDDPTASLRGPDPELFFPPATTDEMCANDETNETNETNELDTPARSSDARLVATPLPSPTVVVGYQRDWLRVASPALALWDKAPFEPLGGRTRDRRYVVAAPRALADAAAETAAEISSAYEILGLGSHAAAATGATTSRHAAVFEGETLDDAVDAAANALAHRGESNARTIGEVVVYLAMDADHEDETLAAELAAEAKIAAVVGARDARDVRATAIPRRALGRAFMRPEHARGLAFAAYARAAAEPTRDEDEDEDEDAADARETTAQDSRARVVAADVTGASRRARPVRRCSDRSADDRGASAARLDGDSGDSDADSDAEDFWRLPAHEPLCALFWRQDDAPRAEETRAPPPPLPTPAPSRLARGLGRASSFAGAANLSRGGSLAPASPSGAAAAGGQPSRASRLAPPLPATTREEMDAEDAARRRERTVPGLHCCYAVARRSPGGRRWVAAAWTDTRGEAFGIEARAFSSRDEEEAVDEVVFERRVARWVTRRCALFGEALTRAAGGRGGGEGGGGGGGGGEGGGGEGGGGVGVDEAADARDARRVARARAFFGDDSSSPATRTVGNVSADATVSPDPDFRRVAVLRLGAASSAASRALEEAARAVVDAGRLAEVLVGEMHAGTNLRSTPDVEDAAIPGETFVVVGADGGVAAAARAPSPRHLGESRGDASVDRVAAVTVRVAAVCGPGSETETPETRRTDAAVDVARRYARLSAASEATTRPRSTRAPPTPPHADAAASLADALARVERFAEDEDEGTRG